MDNATPTYINDTTELYKNEGMAIFIKGKMVIGIHPDNLENNLDALISGEKKIGWDCFKDILNKL